MTAAAAVVLASATMAVAASAYVYQRFATAERLLAHSPEPPALPPHPFIESTQSAPASGVMAATDRELPAEAAFTILVNSFRVGLESTFEDVASTTQWLETSGFQVFYAEVDSGRAAAGDACSPGHTVIRGQRFATSSG